MDYDFGWFGKIPETHEEFEIFWEYLLPAVFTRNERIGIGRAAVVVEDLDSNSVRLSGKIRVGAAAAECEQDQCQPTHRFR